MTSSLSGIASSLLVPSLANSLQPTFILYPAFLVTEISPSVQGQVLPCPPPHPVLIPISAHEEPSYIKHLIPLLSLSNLVYNGPYPLGNKRIQAPPTLVQRKLFFHPSLLCSHTFSLHLSFLTVKFTLNVFTSNFLFTVQPIVGIASA